MNTVVLASKIFISCTTGNKRAIPFCLRSCMIFLRLKFPVPNVHRGTLQNTEEQAEADEDTWQIIQCDHDRN